ncbi:hypothetical protein SCHPADRAFT_1003339, partial [Schizopora paradoxa]
MNGIAILEATTQRLHSGRRQAHQRLHRNEHFGRACSLFASHRLIHLIPYHEKSQFEMGNRMSTLFTPLEFRLLVDTFVECFRSNLQLLAITTKLVLWLMSRPPIIARNILQGALRYIEEQLVQIGGLVGLPGAPIPPLFLRVIQTMHDSTVPFFEAVLHAVETHVDAEGAVELPHVFPPVQDILPAAIEMTPDNNIAGQIFAGQSIQLYIPNAQLLAQSVNDIAQLT